MTRLTRISILLATFFAIDKGVAILRQVIIARQFGLSAELDAFNVANNVPDLLFALISGGAMAMAFIPVLTEILTKKGRAESWVLFSRIVNLAFLVTGVMALVVAIFAEPLVKWQIGIAPGFNSQQQNLVVELMRLNLIATLIFSISGLVMGGLQANQHFLLPAIAPILYNVGQIFGALVLAPVKGIALGGITLPSYGFGVQGLVYGVILGACLHLGIQIPGLLKYKFYWIPSVKVRDPEVMKVLRVLVPRLMTVMIVQLIFLVRDNLASRLATGSVTALTYGWMLQQLPETLIGTAIGTAILPTLAEQVSRHDTTAFQNTIERAVRIALGLSIPAAALIAIGLRPLIQTVFKFDMPQTDLLLWTTRGYLVGLMGHSVLEVSARSFYAQQNALLPLLGGILNLTIYIVIGSLLYYWLGAPGVSLTDSIAFTSQAIFLMVLLASRARRKPPELTLPFRYKNGSLNKFLNWLRGDTTLQANQMGADVNLDGTIPRALIGAMVGSILVWAALSFSPAGVPTIIAGVVALMIGGFVSLLFILPEIRILFHF
jgi:putative peptidoglycan lipid II flippase